MPWLVLTSPPSFSVVCFYILRQSIMKCRLASTFLCRQGWPWIPDPLALSPERWDYRLCYLALAMMVFKGTLGLGILGYRKAVDSAVSVLFFLCGIPSHHVLWHITTHSQLGSTLINQTPALSLCLFYSLVCVSPRLSYVVVFSAVYSAKCASDCCLVVGLGDTCLGKILPQWGPCHTHLTPTATMGHLVEIDLLGGSTCLLVYTPREGPHTSSKGCLQTQLGTPLGAILLSSMYRLAVWLKTPAQLICTLAGFPGNCYHRHSQL